MHGFSLVNDGLSLDGDTFYPIEKTGKSPAILFVHGWTSERKRSFQYAEALAELGYLCLLFDMRGHGTSEGNRDASTSREFLSDAIAAYDYLANVKETDAYRISAIGSSFGGYLLPILSRKRNVVNLALRAPADYPNENFDEPKSHPDKKGFGIMEWRNEQRSSGTYALDALREFKGNVLLIESEKDDRVPHQTIMNYANAVEDRSKLNHVVMEEAPHSIKDGPFKDQVTKILTSWFRDRT
jgi:esterase/lipase